MGSPREARAVEGDPVRGKADPEGVSGSTGSPECGPRRQDQRHGDHTPRVEERNRRRHRRPKHQICLPRRPVWRADQEVYSPVAVQIARRGHREAGVVVGALADERRVGGRESSAVSRIASRHADALGTRATRGWRRENPIARADSRDFETGRQPPPEGRGGSRRLAAGPGDRLLGCRTRLRVSSSSISKWRDGSCSMRDGHQWLDRAERASSDMDENRVTRGVIAF